MAKSDLIALDAARAQLAALGAGLLAAAASSVIGAQERAFRIVRRVGMLVASGGGVSSSFTSGGVRLSGADGVARRVALVGVGYGNRLDGVGRATPVAHDSVVSYRLGGLRESYANGPSGLEQAFTLARRPAGRERGPLTIDPLFFRRWLGAASKSLFGISVALSADGNTALIGGSADDNFAGAAWVFIRRNGSWTEQQKLTGKNKASPITVARLTNGSKYTFTVEANNEVGPGPPSKPSNAVIPSANIP